MTEQDWLQTTDPDAMLELVSGRQSKRKLALFGVACSRRITLLCNDPRSRKAMEVSERYADRQAKIDEVRKATRNARENAKGIARPLGHHVYEIAVLANAAFNANLVSEYALLAAADQTEERASQCAILREIFGNPFRRSQIAKAWLTPAVKELAESIYADHNFERLPQLIRALEVSGCKNAELLNHFRRSDAHVRGCWALDQLTGRK